jgi:hypothetical protein
MGEVIPLRAHVIPRIRNLVKKALDAGCGTRLVCYLNKSDWVLFEAEVTELCTVHVATKATDSVDATVCLFGCRVRVAYDPYVPLNAMWMRKEPETPVEILKYLYDQQRVNALWDATELDPCGAVVHEFTHKGNTP